MNLAIGLLLMATIGMAQTTNQIDVTLMGATLNWIKSAPTPRAEINSTCRCMIIRSSDGSELATIHEAKRADVLVEALATILVNTATRGQYADWREHLDKLYVQPLIVEKAAEKITRSESQPPSRAK